MARSSPAGGWIARALAVIVLTAAPALAQDVVPSPSSELGVSETTVTAGVNVRFLSGSFGSDATTNLVYVPAVLRIDTGRFELAMYFPYLSIHDGTIAPVQGGFVPMRGTLTSAPNAGMTMGAGAHGTGMMGGRPGDPIVNTGAALLTNRSGLGDILASVGYRVIDDSTSGLQLVMSGRLKIPTASSSSLGTGRADAGVTATVRKVFTEGWVYAEAGYLAIGDPEDVNLRNAALWSVGAGRRFSKQVSLLAMAAGNTAILAEFGAPVEIGAGIGIRAGKTTISVIPTVGLSDASPRYALNVGLGAEVFRR